MTKEEYSAKMKSLKETREHLVNALNAIDEEKINTIQEGVESLRKFKNGDVVVLANSKSAKPMRYKIFDAHGCDSNNEVIIYYNLQTMTGRLKGGWSLNENELKLA